MKASVAIQVLPSVPNEDELIRIVDELIAYIESTGLNCYVGPFETTIEGESYDELMEIVSIMTADLNDGLKEKGIESCHCLYPNCTD